MIPKPLILGAIAAIVLLVAGIAAYFGFRSYSSATATKAVVELTTNVTTHVSSELDRSVKSLAQQVSQKLNEGLRGGTISAEETRRHIKLLEQVDQQLAAMEVHRSSANRELFEAGFEYVTDARHLLRRLYIHARLRGETLAELNGLDDLRRGAGTRSSTWISEMVSYKKKLDKTAFDYRNGVTALDASLAAMQNSRTRLAVHVDPALLVQAELINSFRQHLTDSMVRLSNAVESVGILERTKH